MLINFFISYFQFNILSFNELGRLFYFAEPGSVFFTNIIFFHDEVCFFLVPILVFTYWMLYVILSDHIYYSEPFVILTSIFNIECFIFTIDCLRYTILPLLYKSYCKAFSRKYNSLFYLRTNYLYIFGFESSYLFKNINDFTFFNDKNIIIPTKTFDVVSKRFLFSGYQLNKLNLDGKFFEIEELFLLKNLSLDYNTMRIHNLIRYLSSYFNSRVYSKSINQNRWVINVVRSNQPTFNDRSVNSFINNKIQNINVNIQESFFFKRRYLQLSGLFNPYIDVFCDLFTLNEYNNNLYSFNNNDVLKWLEFQYLYIITRARLDSFNLSNLSRGVNRDIIIDSWEYHHSISFEYIWALFPTLVILSIIGPSFILLFSSFSFNDAFMTIKVIGHQWYWSYELGSNDWVDNSLKFDSRILEFSDLSAYTNSMLLPESNNKSFLRLLDVDKPLLLVAHKPINFLITSGDVLHSFAIPSFGIKVDAVPGRINTFYLEGSKLGFYYGQCSELCGFGHGFMPIAVEVVKHKDIVIK